VYAGDVSYQTSVSPTLTETVNAAAFSISATPAPQTISSSGAATITVTITPEGSYTSPISFTAALSPTSAAQVSFSPSQVTPNGGTATTTLTIQGVTSQAFSSAQSGRAVNSGLNLAMLLWIPYGFAGLLFIGPRNLAGRRSPRGGKISLPILRMLLLASIALTMFGCGGVSQSSSPKTQTYQVKITAAGAASGNSGAVIVATTVAFAAQE
jgi:hypothetical protein